ncbi:unnamed protein product [Phytophthora lilii]|uniref:Unnamed protein product n=1 Tax=Phytophthora lilii TaxID=2077276 RepID=A0A9W6TVW9_9STRA|nr:unnamed protein product [Phytophthora lilii]
MHGAHSGGSQSSGSAGATSRKILRGVAVAPQLGASRGSPMRGSSVLSNLRGCSHALSSFNAQPAASKTKADLVIERTSPTRSDARMSPRRANSVSQTIRGFSTESLRTLDSLAVLQQESDRSYTENCTSMQSTSVEATMFPRRGSYALHSAQSSPRAKRLLQTRSLRNVNGPALIIPQPPGTIENSPEKAKTFSGVSTPSEETRISITTQKREALIISFPRRPERQPSHLVAAITLFGYSLAPLYDFWERLQVSHCGQYSVERMLSLNEYCQRVSIVRVLAVCVLFPLGPLFVVILAECMPLKSVEKGALVNYVFWIRHTLMGALLVACAMVQAKSWIPDIQMPMRQILVVALSSAFVYTASNIIIADLWVFPIPFLVVAGAPLMFGIWAISSRLVLGPHPLEGVQDGEFLGRQFLLITSVHAALLALYPAYQAAFLAVGGWWQLGLIALLPGINLALKNVQTVLGSHLEDNLPEVIIFSIDIFSAIYSVLCMHSANSMKMVAITLVLNTTVMLLSLHGMNRRSRVARACRSFQLMERQQQNLRRRQSVLDSVVTAGGSPAFLSTLVSSMLRLLQSPGQLDSTELQTIRLLSGLPQQLSEKNVALLDALAARSVYNNSRRSSETVSVAQIKERYSSAAMEAHTLSVSHVPVLSPPRSKLAQRLHSAMLVIPTRRWLSLRIGTRADAQIGDSGDRRAEDRRSSSKSTDSEASDTERFIQQSSALSSAAIADISLSTSPALPSELKNTSSSTIDRSEMHQNSIPALWQESSDKLLPLVSKSNPVISNVLEETRKQNTRAVKQTLQLLFNNEYIGLIAYTQCIIPMIYLLYMPALHALPNHVYYPTHYRYFGDSLEFNERMMVIGALAVLQLMVLVTLQVFVVKRFGISTIYQIAFVLESRFTLLQGRLLMWLIFAVQSTLVHYGKTCCIFASR